MRRAVAVEVVGPVFQSSVAVSAIGPVDKLLEGVDWW